MRLYAWVNIEFEIFLAADFSFSRGRTRLAGRVHFPRHEKGHIAPTSITTALPFDCKPIAQRLVVFPHFRLPQSASLLFLHLLLVGGMVNYNTIHDNGSSPYGAGDPYYSQSTGYIAPVPQPKKGTSNWVKFGIPIAVIVIAGAVVGAILGIRASKSSDDSSSTSGASSSNPSDVVSVKAEVGRFATATNSEFMVPVYPSTVCWKFCRVATRAKKVESRQTQLRTRCLHLSIPRTAVWRGPATHGSQRTPASHRCDQNTPGLSRLPICGRRFPLSLKTIPT